MTEGNGQAGPTRPTLDERIRERAEKWYADGKLPRYVTILTYDTARVRVGEKDDEFVDVCAPSQDVLDHMGRARGRLARLQKREEEGEKVADRDVDEARDAVRKQTCAFLAEVILEIGTGIVARRPVRVGEKLVVERGSTVPTPAEIANDEERVALIWRGIPAQVLRMVTDTATYLAQLDVTRLLSEEGDAAGNG